jgi:hypothetical protein
MGSVLACVREGAVAGGRDNVGAGDGNASS